MLYLGRNEMKPTDIAPPSSENWLKGAVSLRAYTAQRDHFLQLHERSALRRQQKAPTAQPKGDKSPKPASLPSA